MTLLTKGEFALHRGVGKSAVSNWSKKGLLVMGECPETGAIKVDVERTDARINARVDPMRGRPTGGLPLPAAVVEPAEEGVIHVYRCEVLHWCVPSLPRNSWSSGG
ncbi:hypothetical protein [Sphingomonas hankookensis]|uniref:hypothetical protein n=1 Tax=Sphingomonas hankookensis TaxID=563996 RepID=UPI003D303B36